MSIDDLYAAAILAVFIAIFLIINATLSRRRKRQSLNMESSSENHQASMASTNGDTSCDPEEIVAGEISVIFSNSGKQYPWDPESNSLLEFAESQGIAVESQCRAGECGSCRTQLVEGAVEYTQEPKINVGRGQCLLCISKPKSDVTLAR